MRTLSTYIEYLLMTRHYCFVPGKGAYMMVDESAVQGVTPGIGADSRQVYDLIAPKRTVQFSALHHHDDGILANLLMESEGMTYDQACSFIQRQLVTISDDFSDLASLHTDVDNFGFESLKLETWADIEKRQLAAQEPAASTTAAAVGTPRLEVHRDTVSIPKYWLQRAAVALLIALFFFTDFIGLNRNNNQLASVLNISILKRTVTTRENDELDLTDANTATLAPTASTSVAVEQPTAVEQISAKASTSTLSAKASATTNSAKASADTNSLKASADKNLAKASTNTNPVATNLVQGPYYIIVASTRSEQEANRICRRYQSQDYTTVGILSRDGLFRVYLNTFANQAEAVSYLREIRQVNDRLSKAWMLTLKHDDSLSYIIKNKYNDNQLSMELSHPNPRTERDQG